MPERPLLRIAHSPDPDDAFMWWPLLSDDASPSAVDTGRFRFEAVLQDIETLNHRSEVADLEITAISCAQYPYVADRYAITECGASMGDSYGPKLVACEPMTPAALAESGGVVAVPGERTSALATARMLLGSDVPFEVVPFETVGDRVADGTYLAGLVIHEGQLTFAAQGLELIADLGAWWGEETGMPLPLGLNVIRLDLEDQYGPGTLAEVTAILRRSIDYAPANRSEALGHVLQHARGMPGDLADEFVRLYVNDWTLEFGPAGRSAVETFLARAADAGVLPAVDRVRFVDPV